MKIVDKNTWKRKEHFEFFSQFDEPFFGIISNIECSSAYNFTKSNNISFFAYYLHKSLEAVNKIDELKYRIKNDDVVLYDEINASPTIGRKDGTFAFSYVKYSSNFDIFNRLLKKEIDEVNNSSGLRIAENDSDILNVIHYSSIPWIKFTGLTHARNYKIVDSCPKITFGKIYRENEKLFMPISVNAHHGLVDGKHVGDFLEIFQELLLV